MEDYIYSELENDDRELKNYHETLFFPVVCILFLIALGASIFLFIDKKQKIKELTTEHEQQIDSITNELTYELNFVQTQLEIKTIHEAYGKLSISKEEIEEPTVDAVWDFIKTLNTWYPEYIMAQAIVESNCGNTMPHKSNNMFGMMVPKSRETVAINKNTEDIYAKYRNWKEGVIDRVLWELDVFGYDKPSEEEYLKKLKNYATSETYLSTIHSVAKRYKNKNK
jgi:hypothetical protein